MPLIKLFLDRPCWAVARRRQCPLELCSYALPPILPRKAQTRVQQPKCFQSSKLSPSIYSPGVTAQLQPYLTGLQGRHTPHLEGCRYCEENTAIKCEFWPSASVLVKPVRFGVAVCNHTAGDALAEQAMQISLSYSPLKQPILCLKILEVFFGNA